MSKKAKSIMSGYTDLWGARMKKTIKQIDALEIGDEVAVTWEDASSFYQQYEHDDEFNFRGCNIDCNGFLMHKSIRGIMILWEKLVHEGRQAVHRDSLMLPLPYVVNIYKLERKKIL